VKLGLAKTTDFLYSVVHTVICSAFVLASQVKISNKVVLNLINGRLQAVGSLPT
jgi:hypothetical protein